VDIPTFDIIGRSKIVSFHHNLDIKIFLVVDLLIPTQYEALSTGQN